MIYINLLDGLYLDKGTQCDDEQKTFFDTNNINLELKNNLHKVFLEKINNRFDEEII